MEERFRGRTLWIGLAVLAVIGLCGLLSLLAIGGAAFTLLRPAAPVAVVQPPAVESGGQPGAVQPPAYYPARGYGWHPFGFVFGAFRCLLPLLLIGLLISLFVRRRRCWHGWAWGGPQGPPPPPPPPGAEGHWQRGPHGPWGWHGGHWGPPAGPPAGEQPGAPPPRPGEQD